MQRPLHVTVADDYEKIEQYRSFWKAAQYHPNTDIDGYIEWCQARPEVLRPHVIVLEDHCTPKAMMICRLEKRPIKVYFGYRVVFSSTARMISVMYGGVLGNVEAHDYALFVEDLLRALRQREADTVFFNHVRMDSPLFGLAKSSPQLFCRDRVSIENVHWRLELGDRYDSYDGLLNSWSKNFRKSTRRSWRHLHEEYGSRASFQRIDEEGMERVLKAINVVASKTYHRQIGGGFQDDAAARRILALAKRRGELRVYALLIDGVPIAFVTAHKVKGVVYPGATGYDPAFGEYSPGRLVLHDMIRQLIEEGNTRAVDFGFGDAGYKREMCHSRWTESSVYMFAPTARGVGINALRSLFMLLSLGGARAVEAAGLTQKLKTTWRRRLTGVSGIGRGSG